MLNAETTEMPQKSPSEGAEGLLDGRFRVDFSTPLDFLNNGMNQAFKAVDEHNREAEVFAIVASPYSLPRKSLVMAMEMNPFRGLLDLRARGPVRFGETDIREVYILDLPGGGPVLNGGPVPEKKVVDIVLPSLIEALSGLHGSGMAHRGIRADNIFYQDPDYNQVLLGESITAAAGSSQPAVYEPLESANAHPFARGNGGPADDIYAVGVLLVHLLGGELPCKDLSTEELFTRKLEIGSFELLTAHLQLSQRMGDLLRALLHDDPNRRWGIDTLVHWRAVSTDTVPQGKGDRRTSQKIRFDGEEYVSPRLLAQALTKNPREACNLLAGGRLQSWVRDALRDEEVQEEIALLEQSAREGGRSPLRSEAAMVAQVGGLLDPRGTFVFRDLAFGCDGLGGLLAYAFYEDSTSMKGELAELLESGLLLRIAIQEGGNRSKRRRGWIAYSVASNCLEHMKFKKDPGFGLERCLYELNPAMPCLSPIVLGGNAKSMQQFLEIAEKKLQGSGGSLNPFDRHSAAFIAAKSGGSGKFFTQIGNSAPGSITYTIALIKLFAALQRYHPGPMPGLCQWAEGQLKPLLGKIRSRVRREVIQKRFDEARKTGKIDAILSATDIERQIKLDEKEYQRALKTAVISERHARQLSAATDLRRFAAEKYGRWVTSILSITTLLASMILSALYFAG